jgi:hypothetical protein
MNASKVKADIESESRARVELNVTKDRIFLNLHIPYQWVILVIIALLIWRAPDLWQAVQVALPLLNK